MIIHTTFRDNTYTYILEEYWDSFWFRSYYSAIKAIEDTHEQVEVNIKAEHLLKEIIFNEDKCTLGELKEFIQILKESIVAYIRNKVSNNELDDEEGFYLIQKLQVVSKFRIDDRLDNDESVYYFLRNKQKITM